MGEALAPIVAATREAAINAAKHAGTRSSTSTPRSAPAQVEVFVRDRGTGFDPESIPADRQGVRNSILDRMARHGGTAEIRSTPGSGTEVRLRLPRRGRRPHEPPAVLIVDDHAMFRAGVRAELGTRSTSSPRPPTSTRRSPRSLQHRPDVVLLDVHLPGGGGAEVMRRLSTSMSSADAPASWR